MLPLTLVLILLMRMDGMLMALRLQQQRNEQLSLHRAPIYTDEYETIPGEAYEEMIGEHLLLPQNMRIALKAATDDDTERAKRCLSYKYGTGESLDLEDREIMKDARTSFLPQHLSAIPRECFDPLEAGMDMSKEDEIFPFESDKMSKRERTRRTSGNKKDSQSGLDDKTLHALLAVATTGLETKVDGDILEPDLDDSKEFQTHEDKIDTHVLETTAALQSFWNEQGTREGIRQAQAKTMKQYMDTSIDPCVDFYKYSCGNWEKLHPIPKDKAGFDTFEMLRESLDLVLKQLLEKESDTDTSKPKKSVVQIQDNHFEPNSKTQADIVESSAVDPNKTPISELQDETLKLRAEQLRKHIVHRRQVLSRILERYRRQTTNTKRKRLITPKDVGKQEPAKTEAPKSDVAQPETARVADVAKAIATVSTGIPSDALMRLRNEYSSPRFDAKLKAKNLYKSCINSRLLSKRGVQPLLKLIDDLGGWPVLSTDWNEQHFDWLQLAATLRRYNNDILLVEWVGPDIKNSEENIIQFDQTSLGLPTREYFLQEVNSRYLLAYQRFMSEVMHKLGARKVDALKTAAELIAFETQLAGITAPAELRLNVTKLYKRLSLKQLHDIVPQINWVRYLSALQSRQVQDNEEVVIYATEYMKELVALIAETEPRTLANYIMWRFVRHRINNVDDRFDDIKQNFYHSLFGREESPQRWKVCIAQVNTNMGMAVGSMFVSRYFDDNSKRDTLRMTHDLQQAFRDILKTTDWLDQNTKSLAEQKVNAMSLKIGYPDFILNSGDLNEKYAGIDIDATKYFENTLNVLLHTSKTEQAKLHERVNKTNWQTAPAIVNAYYSRNKNQIMFPAGILQPPFYHRHFPKSLNFGGIGVVIGHELTHGFDDKGRLFDSNGNIHKWWSDSAIRGFDERARCIITQYSNYTVDEVGIALNGESTQGENIADNGGLRQAFHAYNRWLIENPEEAGDERLPGINLTGQQLFFLNFGQVWCGAMRPEAVRNKLNTAIHSPGRFRVIGTLSNSYDFAREFHCPTGSPMNPSHKCSVW